VNIGIIPELASSYLLPRLLGRSGQGDHVFREDHAQQMFELGLVNKILPHDQLIPYAREMAMKLIPPGGA
jgi:enoyl-CoA hydratase/carnithine racemase